MIFRELSKINLCNSVSKFYPPLVVKLKKPSRLIGIPQFCLLPFYFFSNLENTEAIDKSLNWQLRLPRQNALVSSFDAAEFERVGVFFFSPNLQSQILFDGECGSGLLNDSACAHKVHNLHS